MRLKIVWRILIIGFCLLILLVGGAYLYIQTSNSTLITDKIANARPAYTAIVPGALVHYNGKPSGILADRLDVALQLYTEKKIQRFLLTGDHGQESYDEVNYMKKYLNQKGVPDSVIFLDHAGFDTHSSMMRAAKIFGVTDAIVVTQAMYMHRSLYLARACGLNATGVSSDLRHYGGYRSKKIREILACTKAFLEILFGTQPKFLGKKIPIHGDSRLSYDKE